MVREIFFKQDTFVQVGFFFFNEGSNKKGQSFSQLTRWVHRQSTEFQNKHLISSFKAWPILHIASHYPETWEEYFIIVI